MKRSKAENEITAASIFVNPTQFSPGEDLDKYPRPLERDMEMLKSNQIDLLFLPDHKVIYPVAPLCHVEPAAFGHMMEGKARPEFFRGMILGRIFVHHYRGMDMYSRILLYIIIM